MPMIGESHPNRPFLSYCQSALSIKTHTHTHKSQLHTCKTPRAPLTPLRLYEPSKPPISPSSFLLCPNLSYTRFDPTIPSPNSTLNSINSSIRTHFDPGWNAV